MSEVLSKAEAERLRRWRLVLGGESGSAPQMGLNAEDMGIDRALSELYEPEKKGPGGRGGSMPNVARWLGDIRGFFPSSVVQVMQRDALERLNLKRMLMEPELLEAVTPDVHLVANLLALKNLLPAKTRDTARMVVRQVVEELERRLAQPLRQAVMGSLNRSVRNRRPRHNEIDWHRTIRANLKHYQPNYRTIVPEARIGYGRKRSALREVVLCLDQSGSMGTSVVYAGILGAVLASLPALKTHVVAYDTAVVDLTDELADPVEVLFGTQLGGGTDTPQALRYCQTLIRNPQETIFVLITDLFDGVSAKDMLRLTAEMVHAGVQFITLLALDDHGAPSYDHQNAAEMAAMGVPVFACTPDLFPEMMAAAINRQDINQWAAAREIVTARPGEV
jgi:Mg-chelatase subunit ChlD